MRHTCRMPLDTAKDKMYQQDPALESCSKIFLKKMNKTGLQDSYMRPFDAVARSETDFTIRLNNGKIDNVTVGRVKPCFSENDALPQAAPEQYREVFLPAPPAPHAPPAAAAPAGPEQYSTRYGRISRMPSRFIFHIENYCDDFSQKKTEKGDDVAHATWHHSSPCSQEQQLLLSSLKLLYQPSSINYFRP